MSPSIPMWRPHWIGRQAILAVTILWGIGTPTGTREAVAQEPAERIDAIARAQFEAGRFHGGLLVADGERELYRGAFGSSDRARGTPNTPDAPFPIRSITKSFTAVLILQLAQEGALDLDGTVGDYLPAFASPAAGRITLHHLLSHTSGLPDYIVEIPGYMDYRPPNLPADSAMAFVSRLPLEFEPGEGYAYSNTGFVLLGMIVERVTGTSYGDALEERILRPLGMEDTRWTSREAAPGMPLQYLPGGEQEAPAIRHFPGDAGIVSTLDDMHRFARALGSPRLLSPAMWDRAFTAHAFPENVTRPHPATRFPYGYGFAPAEVPVAPDWTARVVMHAGLGYGGSALLQRLIDGDGVVILWNNVGGLPPAMPEILPVLATMPARDGSAQGQSVAGDARSPQHEQWPQTDTLALTNVTLIDGTGAPPRPHVTVLVHGDRIAGVFPVDEAPTPASAEVLDLSGRYLIPGLINTHVHLPMIAWARDSVATGLERMLHAGVTTVREMAGDTRISAELNRAALVEGASLPTIHYAVRMAGPTFYEPVRDTNRAWIGYPAGTAPWAQAVTAETDLARAVAMAAGTGATGLKLYTDLDANLVRGLVAEAHRQGLKAWAHGTLFPAGPLESVRAGIDGLSHVCFLFFGLQPVVAASMGERVPFDPDLVDLEGGPFQELMREMRVRDVVLDATARNASQNPGAHAFGCTPELLNRSLWAAHRAGVRLSTGTDYVIAEGDPDPTLFTEIEYLVEADVLSPLEAITAATLNGAHAIGIEDRYGTIEVGKVADLVVLSDDPTENIGALQNVVAVFKGGRQVSAAARSGIHEAAGRQPTVHVAAPTGEVEIDRASILAALEQVQPGGTVQFAEGTYLIGGIIRVSPDEITLLGDAGGTVIRGCDPDAFPELPEAYFACHGFELAGARQTVRNLTFEYTWHGLFVGCCFTDSQEAVESGGVGPLRSQPGGHLIEGNTFRYTPNGLRVIGESAEPTVVRDNRFIDVYHAVQINGGAVHVLDNDIGVRNPERVPFTHYPGDAINILPFSSMLDLLQSPVEDHTSCSGNVIARNRIEGYPDGIRIMVPDPRTSCRRNEIRDNTIAVGRARWIDIENGPRITDGADSTIVGVPLRLSKRARAGAAEGESGSDARLEDNLIEGNRVIGAEGVAIEVLNASGNRIVNNTITGVLRREPFPGNTLGGEPERWRDANGSGIWLSAGSDGNEIGGNTFQDIAASAVVIEGNSNRVEVRGPSDAVRDLGTGNRVTQATAVPHESGAPVRQAGQTATAEEWSDPSPHEIRFVTVAPGVQLEVLDWGGEGTPIVFLAGLQMNSHAFDDLAPPSTDTHRVVGITRRGHGASSWPDDDHSLERLVEDIRVVLDTLGLERVVFAGHSLAGTEITRFASEHPERVAGLVYIDAAHDLTLIERHGLLAVCPMGPETLEAIERSFENPEAFRRTQRDEAPDGTSKPFVSHTAVAQLLGEVATPEYSAVRASALAVYHTPRWVEDVYGGEATLSHACIAATQRYIYEGILGFSVGMERGRIVALDNTQHNIHLVSPDELEEVMRRWLAELPEER